MTSSMPSLRATACAVIWLSPVIITIVTPSSWSVRIASGVLSLIGSATPRRPAIRRRPRRTSRSDRPGATRRHGLRVSTRRSPRPASARDCRARRRIRPTRPVTPFPVTDSKVSAFRTAAFLASAPSTMAAARGCSLERSSAAESPSNSISSTASACDDADQCGLALRQRAGLVDDERVDLAQHFDRLRVPEQDAHRRALAGRDHDRHRRRQAERTRTRDDQHGDGVDERVRHARRRTHRAPDDEGHDRRSE